MALQQPDDHVAPVPAGVPKLEPLRDQSPLLGVIDRPAVLGTHALAGIGDVDFTIGGVELVD